MNNYELAIDALDLAPYRREWCCVCGKPKTDGHHVVFRSHGGKDKHIVSLCRGCHDKIHARTMHLKADKGRLWVIVSDYPISLNKALRSRVLVPKGGGNIGLWRDLSKRARYFETEWNK